LSLHLAWLLQSQNPEYRGRYIFERALGSQAHRVVRHIEKRHRIRGVIRVRAFRRRIDHGFGISVIGRHQPGTTAALQRLVYFAKACVDRLTRLYRRRKLARMPHHVGIRVIHHNHVEAPLLDCPDYVFRNPGRAHFRQ